MGQISLPRLNRVDTSMFWESFIFYNQYTYNSLKLYIFYKYFIKYFFHRQIFFYKRLWGQKTNFTKFLSYNKKDKNFFLNIYKKEMSFKTLKFYLYTLNQEYFLFFINIKFIDFTQKKKYLPRRKMFFKKLNLYI